MVLNKLELFLKNNGLTQVFFAQMLGISKSAISKWFKSNRIPIYHADEIHDLTNGFIDRTEIISAYVIKKRGPKK